jgi:hypothetical protein
VRFCTFKLKVMMIKNYGSRVESVWEGLRPLTKKMLVGAMTPSVAKQTFSYDIHADWELSQLLTALDVELHDADVKSRTDKLNEIKQLADTCVDVLQSQTESAEIFIQLAERHLENKNYAEIDRLSDIMKDRFSVGEMCEVARQTTNPAIRAIAFETIALMDVEEIIPSLEDPIYEEIARTALEIKAIEYESLEAGRVLENYDFEDEVIEME